MGASPTQGFMIYQTATRRDKWNTQGRGTGKFHFFEHRNSLKVWSLCKTKNDSDI